MVFEVDGCSLADRLINRGLRDEAEYGEAVVGAVGGLGEAGLGAAAGLGVRRESVEEALREEL